MARPVALVTGGRQGLGRAIAHALARKGYDIAVLDLVRDERAEATLGELAALGASTCFVTADIADVDAHDEALDQVWTQLGPVAALVNNAGIPSRPLIDILDLPYEHFDRNLEVNLRGSFFLTQRAARKMLSEVQTGYRSITFITSIAADHVSVERVPYCVSKAGLSMVARLFAQRLAPEIHVHEVRPGFMNAGMMDQSSLDKVDRYIKERRVPLGRLGEAEDVGKVVSELASGALPYTSGHPIYVDGAFHLRKA